MKSKRIRSAICEFSVILTKAMVLKRYWGQTNEYRDFKRNCNPILAWKHAKIFPRYNDMFLFDWFYSKYSFPFLEFSIWKKKVTSWRCVSFLPHFAMNHYFFLEINYFSRMMTVKWWIYSCRGSPKMHHLGKWIWRKWAYPIRWIDQRPLRWTRPITFESWLFSSFLFSLKKKRLYRVALPPPFIIISSLLVDETGPTKRHLFVFFLHSFWASIK